MNETAIPKLVRESLRVRLGGIFGVALLCCIGSGLGAGMLGAQALLQPPFVDTARSISKQRDAANDAVGEARKGGAAAAAVLASLADVSGLVRDRVFRVVVDDWSDEDLATLQSGLVGGKPLTCEAVAEIYGLRKFQGGARALTRALSQAREEESRVLCLWALGEIGDVSTWKPVHSCFKKERRSFRVKAEALRALCRLDAEKARSLVDKAAADKMLPVRIEALQLLAEAGAAPAAVTAAQEVWADPPKDKSGAWLPRLKLTSLAVLRELTPEAADREAWVGAIEALVAASAESRGRERRELFQALRHATGENLPDEDFAWKSWWESQRESWQPREPGESAAPTRTGVVRYHGAQVDSEQLTFIVDASGGMSRPIQEGGDGPTRLVVAKEELAKVMQALDDRTWVNLIYFGSFYASFRDQPVILKAARRKLAKFSDEQQISKKPGHNRGNLYDTILFALTQPQTDAIYVLTEGGPTEGKFQDNDRFLRHLARWNRLYRAEIHTLLIGRTGGRARDLLRGIAEGSGGTYTDLAQGDR